MFDVISIGGLTRDIFFEYSKIKVDKSGEKKSLIIPYGEKLVSESSFYSYGGGAFNTAINFSKLGLKAASVCNIGSEGTGSLAIEQLKKYGVSTKFIRKDKSLHTGLSIFILGKDNEHTGFLERGANNHLLIERWRPLKNTKWFYISSLTGSSAKLLPDFFDFAKKHKIKIAFNPGSEQLSEGYHYLKGMISEAEIIILNYQEAEQLVFSKNKKIPKDEKSLLKEIDKMGAKISVITEDGDGSHAISEGKTYHTNAFSKNVIDTTGAGDSFGSTFVFGIINNYDILYCLKLASINAASVVSKMGATSGLLTYNNIRSSKWL